MISDNIVHFARLLRGAGLPIGPDRVLAAIEAVEQVGVDRRDDVHAALAAVMLAHHEQQPLFDAAFDAFWRAPALAQQATRSRPPQLGPRAPQPANAAAKDQTRFDIRFSFSDTERLQRADFETMSAAEYQWAKKLAEHAPLPVRPVRRRRHRAATRGTLDLRSTLLRMARQPQTLAPAFTRADTETPPLVVLLDISGSMDRYARLFLHYVHGLTRRHLRVHTFTFGTRLTNITRCLRQRDPDVALKRAETQVHDWKGGTRIAACLHEFNRRWARRVLGGNAAVLLVTDGLERDADGRLSDVAAQLRRSAHELVWLNPLLRFDGFEPRAAGVRALLPHVDRFLPVHNLASLADLARALRAPATRPSTLFENRH